MSESSWPNRRANPFGDRRQRLDDRTEAILSVAGIGAWTLDPASGALWWSAETRRIHGVGDDFVPTTAAALAGYEPAGRAALRAAIAAATETCTPWDLELPLVRPDGVRVRVRGRGRARTIDGGALTIIGSFEDVTERYRQARDHQRMALIVKQMTNAAFIMDPGGRTLWVNDAFTALTGYGIDDLRGLHPHSVLQGPETDPDDLAAIIAAMTAAEPVCREIVNYNRARQPYWIESRVDPIRDDSGRLTGFIGITSDITERRRAAATAASELALRAATETLLRDVIENIPAALMVFDASERLVLFNENYKAIMPGATSMAQSGDTLEAITRRKVAADHYAPEIHAAASPAEQDAWVADYLERHRSDDYARDFHLSNGRWVQARSARSASGNIVSLRTDITRLKQAEAELRHVAEHDPLTGLVNRPVLMRRLERHKNSRRANPVGGAVVILDVDFFKAVNDSLGHGAGDTLLRLVARRLLRMVRAGDTVARLGGDEFALVLPGLSDEARLVDFLDRLIAVQRRPVRLGANRYLPSVSVGVTFYLCNGGAADQALSRADAALYEAKHNGRNRFALFGADLAARVARRSLLADRLRLAVANRVIAVALQPQMRLSDGAISGFEALARWHDHGDGSHEWVPPAEFIPIAEDIGLAQSLGSAVMDQALAAHARLRAAGTAPGIIAVNVSSAQLLADDFLEIVRRLLAAHRLPPQCLEIEVTETVLLDRSVTRIVHTLAALRAKGISLSLDDFGTGYASLSSLTAFRVDRIKIDASFTRAIGARGDKGLIARTIINLGRGLGLEVIAEGVETATQMKFLADNGCTAVQGYLLAAPMLPDAALAWLAARPAPRRSRGQTPGILRG